MKNILPLMIGLRYVRSKQSEGFFSLVSAFSFGAMTLGVIALIVVLSVMNGFDREIKSRVLSVVPHISLMQSVPLSDWRQKLARQLGDPSVVSASPFVETQGMLSTEKRQQGVSVQGLDPELGSTGNLLDRHMISGSLSRLQPGEFGVVMGSLLARSLGVMAGDSVVLTLPEMTLTPFGAFPRVKQLRVVGIYQVGAQVDSGIAFVHIADAQTLKRNGDMVDGVRFTLVDPYRVQEVVDRWRTDMGPDGQLVSWRDSLSALFDAIHMEKLVVGSLLTIIIAVAAFNIVASLVLLVADKRKDIAVLRAMGASSGTITGIFRVQGIAVGLSGVVLGVGLGCLLASQLGALVAFVEGVVGVSVFDPEVYFISQLPTDIQWPDVLAVAAVGALISIAATVYPAYRAGTVSPAEVLRYEH
ncbi:MAG: lipoprotein-releasing system transmembrane subunit LolC [Porticoccaceae bacterium]|nr:lipoprotein-releasing system transmembrane subunit LolC [Porticoccaceae bacterium]